MAAGGATLRRATAGLLLGGAIGAALVPLSVDYFPTLDGAHHLFAGHLANHFDDAGAAWHAWLERGHPWTGLGFHLLFSTLDRALPWRAAFQASLVMMFVGWGAAYTAFARALHPARAALGLLGFATSISWSVHMGFFAFAISTALGFATLALAVDDHGAAPDGPAGMWSPGRRALIVLALTAQAIAHAYGAALTGVTLALIVALAPSRRAGPGARAKELVYVVGMGLPAAAIAMTAGGDEQGTTAYLSLADHLTVLPRTFLPGPLWRAYAPLALGALGVASGVRRYRRGEALPHELAIAIAGALFLVLAFAAPMDLRAWQLFAPRFLPMGCLLGAALLPIERLGARARALALGGLAAFTAASLGWTARAVAELRAREDDVIAGASAPLHRRGPRMEVSIEAFAAQADALHEPIPYYAPLHGLAALYGIDQGGFPPFGMLTNPTLHPFVVSKEGRARAPGIYMSSYLQNPLIATDRAARLEVLTYLALVGAAFEDVIVLGRPEDADAFVARGYAIDFRHGGLFIAHLEPCPVTLRISTPLSGRVSVQYSAEPLQGSVRRGELALAASGEERGGDVALAPPICGPNWVRAALKPATGGAPLRCEGADATGRLRVNAQRGPQGPMVVSCRLTPPRTSEPSSPAQDAPAAP